jgi:hypothetical protein
VSTPDEEEEVSSPLSDAAYVLAFISNALPIFTILIATTVLYRGRDIFLPLKMAVILAVIFSPISNFLEPYAGRPLSAAIVVLLAIGIVTGIGFFSQRSSPLSRTKCPDILKISAISWALSKRRHRRG